MRQRTDRIHKEKIISMKPSIDNKPPAQYTHLQNNAKKAQQEEDRLVEIERQNGILLEKLSKIASRKDPATSSSDGRALMPGEARPVGSLNAAARKAELQKVAAENQALLKRIQEQEAKKSDYSRAKLEEEFQTHETYVRLGQAHHNEA